VSARVLLLATTTGYQTRAFGEAAERLGIELVLATDRCDQIDDPWRDGAIAIRFHDVERSVEAIVEAARVRPIDGLLVVGDRPTVIGAHVAKALGFDGHPPEAAATAKHKLRTRQRLRDAGLPVPRFVSLSLDDQSAIRNPQSAMEFPRVVKPLSLSGSRGVMRADDPEEFRLAVERLSALLQSPDVRGERDRAHDAILIEEFIPGREYAIEGVMHAGRLQVLAIFDKPDPLDGPFFEETIYVTPSRAGAPIEERIVDAIARATAAIGLWHGPVHAECRVNEDGVYVLEVAARPIGGLCARALRFRPAAAAVDIDAADADTESSLEELLLRCALGERPDRWERERAASGVMMIPIPRRGMFRSVAGVEAAHAVAHVTDVRITAKPDQLLVPLPEGASYLGFIFARAETPAEVESALRTAHAQLDIRIDAEFRMLPSTPLQYNPAHG
jgi:D-alanine-D-alanine ligase-like ATP-grasp enzyme